jgi:hypothetical protein
MRIQKRIRYECVYVVEYSVLNHINRKCFKKREFRKEYAMHVFVRLEYFVFKPDKQKWNRKSDAIQKRIRNS